MQTITREVDSNLHKPGREANLPSGYHIELCSFGSLHHAKIVDENGVMRRWLPRPQSDAGTLIKFICKLIFQGCLVGAVDPQTARLVEDTRRAPNPRLLADGLRQLADSLEKRDQPAKGGSL
jgi:hypothetical protein